MGKWPVDSADTLGVKNFVEIALSCTVIEINAFLHLKQKLKMASKNGRKNDFLEKWPIDFAETLPVKNFVEISLSHRYRDKCILAFYQKYKMARQIWLGNNFWGK